ncbi:MAG: hypothetical protein IJ156_07300 [Bacteroidales bacterium]|nr:hypothetical protein [Bacteroidales bacterium]
MTTERDIRNQIAYAEEKGERQALVRTAKRMVQELGYSVAQAAEATGLAPEAFVEA